MTELYPLLFHTIFKDKIWGGEKIRTVLHKDFSPLPNCGETWELSGVDGNISSVRNGSLAGTSLNEVLQQYGANLVGEKVYEQHGNDFPLLIKFIDANDDLSIQVHPNDELAAQRHNSFGKTEMWYIMQADEGATLYNGFDRPIDGDEYRSRVADNTILEVMHKQTVGEGDVYFIPAGRVHSIGKGILLAEIQQTSDITYRIYDFDRRDAEGNGRELHTEESVNAIDYSLKDEYRSLYTSKVNKAVPVVECPYFKTSVIDVSGSTEWSHEERDSFSIFIVVSGEGSINCNGDFDLKTGDVLLIPASISNAKLFSENGCRIIETFIP